MSCVHTTCDLVFPTSRTAAVIFSVPRGAFFSLVQLESLSLLLACFLLDAWARRDPD